MKSRITICAVLALMLILSSCTAQTEEITISDFVKEADIKWNDFSYSCTVQYNSSKVTVTVNSTNAAGVVMEYDANNFVISYGGMIYENSDAEALTGNPAQAIFGAVEGVNSANCSKTHIQDGFEFKGNCFAGDYVCVLNEDKTVKSIEYPDKKLYIEFKNA